MKSVHLFIVLSFLCLLFMITIDYMLGPDAEFLNAFSVLERILGKEPSAGVSSIAREYGAAGEFVVVVLANCLAGAILTVLARLVK